MTSERNNAMRRRLRKHALTWLKDGTPCPRCGWPMYKTQDLDLGHVIPFALGGRFADGIQLEHRSCSRSAGATLGNRLRGTPGAPGWRSARQWLSH